MSSAVILLPALIPVSVVAAYVSVGCIALLTQWVMHATGQENCREALARASEEIIEVVRSGIGATLEAIRKQVADGAVSERSGVEILREAAHLQDVVLPEILEGVRQGKLTKGDLVPFRQRLEQLELLVAQHQALLTEHRKRSAFLAGKVESLLRNIKEKAAADSPLEALEARAREILGVPDARIEERVAELTSFAAGLNAMAGRNHMRELVDRLLPHSASSVSAAGTAFDASVRLKAMQADIGYFLERLGSDFPASLTGQLRESAAVARESTNPQQVSAVRDALRLAWQAEHSALVLSNFFRERLEGFLGQLGPAEPLHVEIGAVLREERIGRETFDRLFLAFETWLGERIDAERHRVLEESVRTALGKLDYVLLQNDGPAELAAKLRETGTALLETRHPDYALMLRLGANDAVAMRLIRIVEREEDKRNVSEFQRTQDTEMKAEWCRNADVFKELLDEAGVRMVEKLRVEDDVQYFTLEQLEGLRIDVSHFRRRRAKPATALNARLRSL